QSVNAGSTATLSVVATGTQPLSYQWQKNLANLSGETNSSLVLNSVQPSDAGNYRVIVSSPYGTAISSNAVLTVNVSTVRVINTSAVSGGNFVLPIELTALGNENTLGFSLSFDPAIFTYTGSSLGSGLSATLISNTNQLGTGKLGLGVALSANQTFTAGTQQLVQVSFKVAPVTNALGTSINFGDQPTVRQVSDAGANVLWSSFIGGIVSIAAVDFEADVSPRPTGNRALTITDWVQVGRFAAGLDTVANAGELQRADCAPRSTSGNGQISITDWVQAGRYATGVDPLTPVGGPSADVRVKKTPEQAGDVARIVNLEGTNQDGQTNIVSVRLIAQGDENAMGFSLSFDPAILTFVEATNGGNASGALLNVNPNDLAGGRVGVALSLATGNNFPAGTQEVIKLTFVAAPTATGTTTLTFADAPILREVSDSAANSLAASYSNGSLVLSVPGPLLMISKSTEGVVLSWPASATNFVLESSSSIGTNWTVVATGLTTNGQSISATLPIGEQQQFFRLKK
ncbi:MAG: immunoglobulin domain-containing protein, partial [Verrucomicrobiota bacterium]